MVSAILPYVAAEEAAEQRALEARTQQVCVGGCGFGTAAAPWGGVDF